MFSWASFSIYFIISSTRDSRVPCCLCLFIRDQDDWTLNICDEIRVWVYRDQWGIQLKIYNSTKKSQRVYAIRGTFLHTQYSGYLHQYFIFYIGPVSCHFPVNFYSFSLTKVWKYNEIASIKLNPAYRVSMSLVNTLTMSVSVHHLTFWIIISYLI